MFVDVCVLDFKHLISLMHHHGKWKGVCYLNSTYLYTYKTAFFPSFCNNFFSQVKAAFETECLFKAKL